MPVLQSLGVAIADEEEEEETAKDANGRESARKQIKEDFRQGLRRARDSMPYLLYGLRTRVLYAAPAEFRREE